jgi:hypothetical protein
MQALAQMIRFVRDLPRVPLTTWEYWAGEKVKLCTPDTVALLRDGGYGDPSKTQCVLCGATEFKRGLDWWSLDGIVGPACFGGRCSDSGKKGLTVLTGGGPCLLADLQC